MSNFGNWYTVIREGGGDPVQGSPTLRAGLYPTHAYAIDGMLDDGKPFPGSVRSTTGITTAIPFNGPNQGTIPGNLSYTVTTSSMFTPVADHASCALQIKMQSM